MIEALITTESITKCAEMLGCNRKSIYDRLRKPEFYAKLQQQRKDSFALTTSKITNAQEKCRYNYKGNDTYAFVMSDRYIMSLYTYCLSARKAVALENIEMEGISEAELAMVKLERVREVLFQALLLDDVKFEDGKMYAEFCTVYLLE